MAEHAYSVVYRDEWIRDFGRYEALLRKTVTTEAIISGRQAVFLIAHSNRSAVSRGSNGLIPSAVDDLTQATVTLVEAHDLPQKTNFNILVGQSNQRAIMQRTSRDVINREIDDKIIDALETGTVEANVTPQIMTKELVTRATTRLYNANVPNDGMLFGLLTPAAWAYLSDIPSFASSDYVGNKPMVEGAPTGPEMRRWLGVWWMQHTGLPGMGTADADCFIYHKSAVGHAYSTKDIQALAGYNEEQDYTWARTTIYHGSLKLLNAGIVKINHDDSGMSA